MSKSKPLDTLNRAALQEELQELAGDRKVRVRLDPQGAGAVGVRETDRGIEVYLNPGQIRTEKRLQGHINWLRTQIA